jgi:hypothetical protein
VYKSRFSDGGIAIRKSTIGLKILLFGTKVSSDQQGHYITQYIFLNFLGQNITMYKKHTKMIYA